MSIKPLKVLGVLTPGKEHKKMLTVYNACVDANIDPPETVLTYLKDRVQDFIMDITDKLVVENGDFILDISELPKGCKSLKISIEDPPVGSLVE